MKRKLMMKISNLIVWVLISFIFLVVLFLWYFFTKPIGGIYTDGYQLELIIEKSKVISMMNKVPTIKNSWREGEYCHRENSDKNNDVPKAKNRTSIYFEYEVNNQKYLHACILATTWDNKTILIYNRVIDSDCYSYSINNQLNNRSDFIVEFRENVLIPSGILNLSSP